jgi:hypothetical protein
MDEGNCVKQRITKMVCPPGGPLGGIPERCRTELAKKKELIEMLRAMEKKHGAVTLLFGAKDEQRNQAVVLRGLLKGKA